MTTIWDGLTEDLIEEVILRMPVTAASNIGTVCKKWNAIKSSSTYVKRCVNWILANEMVGILCYTTNSNKHSSWIAYYQKNTFSHMTTNFVPDCICNGKSTGKWYKWLEGGLVYVFRKLDAVSGCISRRDRGCTKSIVYVCNPVTKTTWDVLPAVEGGWNEKLKCIGCINEDKRKYVIVVAGPKYDCVEGNGRHIGSELYGNVMIYDSSQRLIWRHLDCYPGGDIRVWNSCGVYMDGVMYWLLKSYGLLAFHIEEEKWDTMHVSLLNSNIEGPWFYRYSVEPIQLVACGGRLVMLASLSETRDQNGALDQALALFSFNEEKIQKQQGQEKNGKRKIIVVDRGSEMIEKSKKMRTLDCDQNLCGREIADIHNEAYVGHSRGYYSENERCTSTEFENMEAGMQRSARLKWVEIARTPSEIYAEIDRSNEENYKQLQRFVVHCCPHNDNLLCLEILDSNRMLTYDVSTKAWAWVSSELHAFSLPL